MGKELKCPICGEPTFIYFGNPRKDHLCQKHGQDLKKGLIEQCPDCGKWHSSDEECKCKKAVATITQKEDPDELTCILCGQPSNGRHFCIKCWKKYNNKIVYIQVKNCKEFTTLESEYESELVCDDGHLVKSPYEKIIDNWLYSSGIKHAYERKIDVSEIQDLTPDFYIPEYNGTKDIYVEFWGYGEENKKYQQIKEYKMSVYPELVKRDNIAVVYLNKKEIDNDKYKTKIKYAEQGKIKE